MQWNLYTLFCVPVICIQFKKIKVRYLVTGISAAVVYDDLSPLIKIIFIMMSHRYQPFYLDRHGHIQILKLIYDNLYSHRLSQDIILLYVCVIYCKI